MDLARYDHRFSCATNYEHATPSRKTGSTESHRHRDMCKLGKVSSPVVLQERDMRLNRSEYFHGEKDAKYAITWFVVPNTWVPSFPRPTQ